MITRGCRNCTRSNCELVAVCLKMPLQGAECAFTGPHRQTVWGSKACRHLEYEHDSWCGGIEHRLLDLPQARSLPSCSQRRPPPRVSAAPPASKATKLRFRCGAGAAKYRIWSSLVRVCWPLDKYTRFV